MDKKVLTRTELLKRTLQTVSLTRLLILVMRSQTGVNPVHLQAARKARKKQREKANGNQNSPLKICARVSICLLVAVYTVSCVDSVNMRHAGSCTVGGCD